MKKLLLFIIAILVLTPNLIVFGDTREEFRGVWVSTVLNLDFPKSFDEKAQKEEIIKILDTCRDLNINAVFFQVKPAGDAFYKSKYLPYSEYLTGEFGKEPSYDVLAFFIEEAKKRGIELHAWFNPYRVSMNTTGESVTSGKSLVKKYPQWVKIANNRYVFDPGIPEVREFIINCVMEVVENYDIAGVHFDDYFYYESDSSKLDDDETFKKYGGGFENKDDWRRNNTYLL
ncbi:MAG: family 10 glycosylhydrolase, partial [Clostridiaceae bacterium]|nr:family 10 glycosylhydrolase [Clostridiaceae bacterium]